MSNSLMASFVLLSLFAKGHIWLYLHCYITVFTGLPHVPRVGDEVKRFGLKPYKVHRVVWYLDGGYPRIYLYESTNID